MVSLTRGAASHEPCKCAGVNAGQAIGCGARSRCASSTRTSVYSLVKYSSHSGSIAEREVNRVTLHSHNRFADRHAQACAKRVLAWLRQVDILQPTACPGNEPVNAENELVTRREVQRLV